MPRNTTSFGPEYDPELDGVRVATQLEHIKRCMLSADAYLTLAEIAAATNYPQSSISAQLRHLRKPQHGSYIVDKKRRGDPKQGLYEYRVFDHGEQIPADVVQRVTHRRTEAEEDHELRAILNKINQWSVEAAKALDRPAEAHRLLKYIYDATLPKEGS